MACEEMKRGSKSNKTNPLGSEHGGQVHRLNGLSQLAETRGGRTRPAGTPMPPLPKSNEMR